MTENVLIITRTARQHLQSGRSNPKVTLFVLAVILFLAKWIYNIKTDPFYGGFRKYTQVTAKQEAVAYLRGKIIAVDVTSRSFPTMATLQDALPAEWRARRSDEVTTAILVKTSYVPVGYYSSAEGPLKGVKTPANRICWELRIIDMSIPAIVNRPHICGADPTTRNGEPKEFDPVQETMAYLLDLPRK